MRRAEAIDLKQYIQSKAEAEESLAARLLAGQLTPRDFVREKIEEMKKEGGQSLDFNYLDGIVTERAQTMTWPGLNLKAKKEKVWQNVAEAISGAVNLFLIRNKGKDIKKMAADMEELFKNELWGKVGDLGKIDVERQKKQAALRQLRPR